MNEDIFEKPTIGHTGGGQYNLDDMAGSIAALEEATGLDAGEIIARLARLEKQDFQVIHDGPMEEYPDLTFHFAYVQSGNIYSFWGEMANTSQNNTITTAIEMPFEVFDLYQGEPMVTPLIANMTTGIIDFIEVSTGQIKFSSENVSYGYTAYFTPQTHYYFQFVLVLNETEEE